jgi:amino-acid N-acetyltransferase
MLVRISPAWGSEVSPSSVAALASEPQPLVIPRTRAQSKRISVRAARIADMRAVEPLIQTFASQNRMLPKTFDELARNFREFAVAVGPAGEVIGCGALRTFNENLAEVTSLAVARPAQGMGVGRRLVKRLIRDARELGIGTVFALTLEPGFFAALGFRIVAKENFPAKVWADCRKCPKLHACDEVAMALDLGGR